MRLKGKVVAITGGSRGLGRCIALEAARRGARVGVVARTTDQLESVVAEIAGMGGTGFAATADVCSYSLIGTALDAVEANLGSIDVLVANAGIGYFGPFSEMEPGRVEKLFDVNVLGALYPVRWVLSSMTARGRGHLVLVSSITGHIGVANEAVYSATKSALSGFGEALRAEIAGSGIGVTVACPGPITTTFFEERGEPYSGRLPRPADPVAVAASIIDGIERERAEIILPRWLRIAIAVKGLAPPVFRAGLTAARRR